MAGPRLERLPAFSTIGWEEKQNILDSLKRPLSGYIGGVHTGGYYVEALTEAWKEAFNIKYAIPCNSATSGLLAACMAVGIGPGDKVWTTPYSMSATAACAKVLGATVRFIDIEPNRFGIDPDRLQYGARKPKAIIVTNLFGHPAQLYKLMEWCLKHECFLIEDNAQSPFARTARHYAGTIGHIGVFSLNVHKHIQCGEGGVVVTHFSSLANRVREAVNHGELTDRDNPTTGLNLRMTEPIAAIACAQLEKAKTVIQTRIDIAEWLTAIFKEEVPWVRPHEPDTGCTHVYYLWTALVPAKDRALLVAGLVQRGVPIRGGYAPLLNKLFKSTDECPIAEETDKRIIVFEVCAFDLRTRHLKTIREIVKRVAGDFNEDRPA